MLSLNILLLAFFILLNSMASFEEERRDAVVDSVREAFQGLVPADRNLTADPAALDIFEGADDVIDSLNQLFGDNLPLVESQDAAGNRVIKVDMPAGDLFAAQGDALRPDGAETLRLIGAVLDDPRFISPGYQVDVLYGLPGKASGIEGNRPALMRAGTVVRELVRQGLPPARLSAGLLPELPDQVRILFTIRLEAPPPAAADDAATPGAPAAAGDK
ncbi:MAG: flagellar motor protein MotB [Kiloniellaceae bacterium]